MSPPQDQLLTHPIPFGSDENCTLDNCLVSWSILSYRPDLAANIVFCVYFALVGLVQIYLGVRWRSWGFMTGMILGCMTEVIGYVGRVIMYNDPFSYPGFLVQISESPGDWEVFGPVLTCVCDCSLPDHRPCLLHGVHLRDPLQGHQFLRA